MENKMNVSKQLEQLIKDSNGAVTLPQIRYFDGIEMFCDAGGNFKGKTLDESLKKFIESYNLIEL